MEAAAPDRFRSSVEPCHTQGERPIDTAGGARGALPADAAARTITCVQHGVACSVTERSTRAEPARDHA